ncbi:DHH family phosphoesterase [Vibrio cyclitrophicus]
MLHYGEKVHLIVGDFDADGATSTSVCLLALRMMVLSMWIILFSNRFDCGCGLSPGIVAVAQSKGVEVLITVDNGISSIEGVAAAKALTVAVTDHHLPGKSLPIVDAIVNPNQAGCEFASKIYCRCGRHFI